MNVYDRGARRAIQREPLAVLRRLAQIAFLRWRFRDWAQTQTTPKTTERDQIADCAVVLEDLRVPSRLWLALLEFQSRHVVDKMDDMLVQATQMRRNLRHGPLAEDKYWVLPVLVYLAGTCPDAEKNLDMITPIGHGINHKPVFWEVALDSASGMLDLFAQDKTFWGILFWIPLMAGADDPQLVDRWLKLVRQIEDESVRADLIGIALVFAELAGRGRVWRPVLERWHMTESPIVNEWIGQACEEARLDERRQMLVRILNKRFPGQVTRDILETINGQPTLKLLGDWVEEAAVLNLQDFRAHLQV